MNNEKTIIEWCSMFNNGQFNKKDFNTQVGAGWYDWFCEEEQLVSRTKKLANIIKKIKSGGKVDMNLTVAFKNCCPLCFPLYDTIWLSDKETGEVEIEIKCDHPFGNENRYLVYSYLEPSNNPLGKVNKTFRFVRHENPDYETNDLRNLIKWLNTPWNEVKN